MFFYSYHKARLLSQRSKGTLSPPQEQHSRLPYRFFPIPCSGHKIALVLHINVTMAFAVGNLPTPECRFPSGHETSSRDCSSSPTRVFRRRLCAEGGWLSATPPARPLAPAVGLSFWLFLFL